MEKKIKMDGILSAEEKDADTVVASAKEKTRNKVFQTTLHTNQLSVSHSHRLDLSQRPRPEPPPADVPTRMSLSYSMQGLHTEGNTPQNSSYAWYLREDTKP